MEPTTRGVRLMRANACTMLSNRTICTIFIRSCIRSCLDRQGNARTDTDLSNTKRRDRNCRGRDDPSNYVLNFAQSRQLPLPFALDVDGAHARVRNTHLTPLIFIVRKEGTVLEQKIGDLDFVKLSDPRQSPGLLQLIEALLCKES